MVGVSRPAGRNQADEAGHQPHQAAVPARGNVHHPAPARRAPDRQKGREESPFPREKIGTIS